MGQPMPIQPPCRLKGGLADVAGPMPMSFDAEEGWRWGVQYQPVCGLDRFIWGCGRFDEVGDKPVNDIDPVVNFDYTTLGVAVECGPNGERSPIGDIARFIAEQGLERYYWSDLAGVMATGEVGTGTPNPSLQSTAVIPAGQDLDAPSGIIATIAGLLEQAQNCWCADVVFHVPAQYLPYFVQLYLVEWDEARNVWHMGPYDFSFDTYPNVGPPAAEILSPTETDGSQVWIYMTSRPLAGVGPVDGGRSRSIRQNEYLVVAERPTIIIFDPCCVGAAKAEVCG